MWILLRKRRAAGQRLGLLIGRELRCRHLATRCVAAYMGPPVREVPSRRLQGSSSVRQIAGQEPIEQQNPRSLSSDQSHDRGDFNFDEPRNVVAVFARRGCCTERVTSHSVAYDAEGHR